MVTETQTRNITYTQAINEAMAEEMRLDQRVFIMGEDIQKGVYGASGGLYGEFGGERVRDCPLSENAFFRRCGRGGGGGDAPHRREPVQLHVGGDGPACQPGIQDALHVRRTG